MKTIKTLSTKLFALSIALLFAAGCATVTDANFDAPENSSDSYTTATIDSDNSWFSTAGNDMDPIIDERDTTEL